MHFYLQFIDLCGNVSDSEEDLQTKVRQRRVRFWRIVDPARVSKRNARWTDTPWSMQHVLLHSLDSTGLRHIHQTGGHWTWDPNIQQCLECYSERLQKNGVPAHMLNVAVKQLNRFVVEKLGDIEKLAKRQEQKEARGDGAEEM
ncbi:hypothetical protein V5799_009759 [Amblyomma americanum]|uniref:Uncharacterized protein n=1 Tax=Amblyomma americanum TaxID=6943 RepID=A0AAQ4F9X7_AMBAM